LWADCHQRSIYRLAPEEHLVQLYENYTGEMTMLHQEIYVSRYVFLL
jgi:hypothetical protein